LAEFRAEPPEIEGELIYPCELRCLTNTQLSSLDLNQPKAQSRLVQGDQLAIVLVNNEVAHRTLVQTHGAARTEGQRNCFCLQEGQAYIHFCETAPRHRGRSLYPAVLRHVLRTLKRQGKLEVFICSNAENEASVRGICKAGFQYLTSFSVLSALAGRISIIRGYCDRRFAASAHTIPARWKHKVQV
jgi:ribosomal protein S18 acetylase RimI-like enzyme